MLLPKVSDFICGIVYLLVNRDVRKTFVILFDNFRFQPGLTQTKSSNSVPFRVIQ